MKRIVTVQPVLCIYCKVRENVSMIPRGNPALCQRQTFHEPDSVTVKPKAELLQRIFTCMLSICLLLSYLAMTPGTIVQAKNVQPQDRQLTSQSITIIKDSVRFCGTFRSKLNVLSKAAFVGDFCDDAGEVYLDIFKSGKQYLAFYSQFRLAQMDLKGTVKNGILTLKGSDPAGKPITVTVSRKGKKRIFQFKKTSWMYFEQGSTMELKRCKGKMGYGQALS